MNFSREKPFSSVVQSSYESADGVGEYIYM